MVQLKEVLQTGVVILKNGFQYLYGAIKRLEKGQKFGVKNIFQYLYGAIKRRYHA